MSETDGKSRQDFDTSSEVAGSEQAGATDGREPVLGFVVLWSSVDTRHLGAWLPVADGASSTVRVLGRGAPGDAAEGARVAVVLQRPDGDRLLPPFQSTSLSRAQLELSPRGLGSLLVKNQGRLPLRKNGELCEDVVVEPGDVLEIGRQLALLCTVRAKRMEGIEPDPDHAFGEPDRYGFVGESPAAWRVRARAAFAAPHSGHVLILGPSGTGKELIAQRLHALSGRKGNLVSRNAATLPPELVDAELFGNRVGYPNPGMVDRPGLVGEADRGTLFLDEFADLPNGAQAHLLRVLDAGEYHRLGESTARCSSLRLIAATNRPESDLRPDMLARFDFRIEVPDLKARVEDMPFLAAHLLRQMTAEHAELASRSFTPNGIPRLSTSLLSALAMAPLPGNVRELRQVLWATLAEQPGDALEWPRVHRPSEMPEDEPPHDELAPHELQRVLDANNGSIEKSWRAAGLSSRHALARLVKKHGLRITRRG
ncbi:MAG TPA: sigma 54-interacting transcriptional regulator [Polyangiaceae bacterium]